MKIISTIHKIPLNVFIDALVDHDFSGLILEGEPDEAEISAAWENILNEYNDALGDDGNKAYVIAYREYMQARINYDMVNQYIELLNNYYVPKWADELNFMVNGTFDFQGAVNRDIDEYRGMLKNCFARNKANLMRVNLAKIKIEEFAKVQGAATAVKPDRGYFTKVMVNLKNKNNREIPETISTYEFCVLVSQYQQYVKMMEGQKK